NGGLFDHPFGVAVEASGQIIVANGVASAGLVRVDPTTGAQSTLSSGGNFRNPQFVAIVPSSGTLSVNVAGSGSGTVQSTPVGIACPGDCSESYSNGTTVALQTTPSWDSVFAGWNGDSQCSTGVVSLQTDTTCEATFNLAFRDVRRSADINFGTD